MALIGKIRRNSWILIVLLGGALAAFVIMDMTANRTGFSGGQFNIGEVGDVKIGYNEFQTAQSILYQGTATNVFDQREYLWNYFVEEAIVTQEAEKLGLSVGEIELNDLQFGNNLSPIVRQRFTNPNTGMVDYNQLNQFRQALMTNTLAPEYRAIWTLQEQEVIKDRLQTKLTNLITKGLYTPTWLAEARHLESNKTIDFAFVQVPFDEIDDSEIMISDSDILEYIRTHEAEYTQEEELRNLQFIAFDVTPTDLDTLNLVERITSIKDGFQETEDDSIFVENNYGTYDRAYFKRDALDQFMADSIFDLPLGSVFGPYIQDDAYRLVKVLDRKVIPDSVQVRHIIRTATTQQEYISGAQLIDSLEHMVRNGVQEFDSLAMQYSQGPSAPVGGDLGWTALNQMVKTFNDLIFFYAEVDSFYTLVTEFGVHLVQVTGKQFITREEGIRYAVIEEPIIPSEETQNAVYDRAQDFLTEYRTLAEMVATAEASPELTLEESGYVGVNEAIIQSLSPLATSTARDMINWAFSNEAEPGDVAPIVYSLDDLERFYTSKYIVVGLEDIQEDGLATVESVRSDVELLVRNQKKGEVILQRIGEAADFSSLATNFSVEVDTAENVKFSSSFVTGIGNEPKVVGHAFRLRAGETSDPILGNAGVYVIEVLDVVEPFQDPDIAAMRRSEISTIKTILPLSIMQAMEKQYKVVDNRSTFF